MKKDNQPICKTDQFGTKCWLLNDQLHREDGPAVEYANGNKSWLLHGQYHRVGGPAIEYVDGSKKWLLHGQRHRIDGPAVEWFNGDKRWYYYGKIIDCSSQEEFERLIKLKALW